VHLVEGDRGWTSWASITGINFSVGASDLPGSLVRTQGRPARPGPDRLNHCPIPTAGVSRAGCSGTEPVPARLGRVLRVQRTRAIDRRMVGLMR
jgi:hypothetical protein